MAKNNTPKAGKTEKNAKNTAMSTKKTTKKKKKVSCAALGTCIVELQDRVNLRNVDESLHRLVLHELPNVYDQNQYVHQ